MPPATIPEALSQGVAWADLGDLKPAARQLYNLFSWARAIEAQKQAASAEVTDLPAAPSHPQATLVLSEALAGLAWPDAKQMMGDRFGLVISEVDDLFVVKPDVAKQGQMCETV